MMLLTDEELADYAHTVFGDKGILIVDGLRELTQTIAKAQLKTVVEWMAEQKISSDDTGLVFLGMESADWQSLLKEVGL